LEPERWSGAVFGGAIELVGYSTGTARAGEPLPITLVWRALADLDRDLTVFVHLQDESGATVGQQDREPGQASFRTSSWQAGTVVVDRYLPLLASDTTGGVTPVIGWYHAATGERLTLDGDSALALDPVEVVE
jgi:hypothetical protein